MALNFEWDTDNLRHIGRHGLAPEDIEPIVTDVRTEISAFYLRNGELRATATGAHADGRIVVVVFTPRWSGAIRVVTAYPASPRRQREYRERQP